MISTSITPSGARHTRWHECEFTRRRDAVDKIASWWKWLPLLRQRECSKAILRGVVMHANHDVFLTLAEHAGVRREWRRCPLDWQASLARDDAPDTIKAIVKEAQEGLWQ